MKQSETFKAHQHLIMGTLLSGISERKLIANLLKERKPMFRQRQKKRKRLTSCRHPKHLFTKNKGKCNCGNYYKDNGRIFRNKGDRYVAGTTAEFKYTGEIPTKRNLRSKIKKILGRK